MRGRRAGAALAILLACAMSLEIAAEGDGTLAAAAPGELSTVDKETSLQKPAEDLKNDYLCEGICRLDDPVHIDGLTYDHSMKLFHADQFSVDYYQGGVKLISVEDTGRYLLPAAQSADQPEEGLSREILDWAEREEVTVLPQSPDSIYLAATSAMDFFDVLDELDRVRLSCEEEGGWYSENANLAMAEGRMIYAGKYSAPDYEKILEEGCDLAVESTMVYHKPEVKEMLEQFGIPVLVEHSSYETDPLGRSEWIRFYGALLGCEEKADALFAEMEEKVRAVTESDDGPENDGDNDEDKAIDNDGNDANDNDGDNDEKLVAFFSINSRGLVTVRKGKDYVPAMIELAGGRYVFPELGAEDENALSTVNLQMEEFYAGAKEADYLIYNSTIAGAIHSVSELLDKAPMLRDFKALKEGNVWCTQQSLFQKPTGLADLIVDMHRMLGGENGGDYHYLYHVE